MENLTEDTTMPAYGTKLDGTPKRGPGGRPPKIGVTRRTATSNRATAPAPKPKPPTPKTPVAAIDHAAGLRGWQTIIALPLLLKSPPDGMAVMVHGDALIESVVAYAPQDERLTHALDIVCSASPYAAIFSAGAALLAQIASNHGWLAPKWTASAGALPQAELENRFYALPTVRRMMAEAETMAEAARTTPVTVYTEHPTSPVADAIRDQGGDVVTPPEPVFTGA